MNPQRFLKIFGSLCNFRDCLLALVKTLSLSWFAIYVTKPFVQKQSINPVRDSLFPDTAGRVAGADRLQRTEAQRQQRECVERLEDLTAEQNWEQTDQ